MTWDTLRFTKFWDIDVFIWLTILIIVGLCLAIAFDFSKAWRNYCRSWRHVKPHYGSTYSGLKGDQAKPNVSLWRTR